MFSRLKARGIEETFLAGEHDKKIYLPKTKEVAPDYVNPGSLNALVISGVLHRKSVTTLNSRYTLTRAAYEIADFDFSNPEPVPFLAYIKKTYRLITKHFNRSELRPVCLEVGINTDWVFGDDPDWPYHLLLYLYRQNRLGELTLILKAHKPAVDWPSFPVGEV